MDSCTGMWTFLLEDEQRRTAKPLRKNKKTTKKSSKYFSLKDGAHCA